MCQNNLEGLLSNGLLNTTIVAYSSGGKQEDLQSLCFYRGNTVAQRTGLEVDREVVGMNKNVLCLSFSVHKIFKRALWTSEE